MNEALRPYVPRLAIDWLRRGTGASHQRLPGTLVFADISGFTSLTERLAHRGKAGAEEMGDVLNATFETLLTDAYAYGAALLKWGGDAVLLRYEGDGHALRACRAAWDMQRSIRRVGRLHTSVGLVSLRMSVGIHSGDLDLFFVGQTHKELVVAGRATTTTAEMEAIAAAGEVVMSAATASLIEPDLTCPHPSQKGCHLLVKRPVAVRCPSVGSDAEPAPDLTRVLPAPLAEHLACGRVDYEHRQVATAFVQFSGVDAMLDDAGPPAVADALGELVEVADQAAGRHGVTFLATDVARDGGKIILLAGAPRSLGASDQRILCAAREIVDLRSPLALRSGVTRGRVFLGDFGLPYRRTYSVVGDSVNLAARLMAKAGVGEVITTPDVIEHAGAAFPVSRLEPFRVKGKADPVDAVAVLGLPEVGGPTAHAHDLPFEGRDNELVALLDAVITARSGQGRVIEVVSEPGLGKTRLVDEFVTQIDGSIHRGSCDVYSASCPYSLISGLLRSALGIARATAPEALATTLVARVRARRPELVPWLPLVGVVIGVELPVTPEVEALAEEFRGPRQAEVIVEVLAALIEGSAVFVVEDVHLADRASGAALSRLAAAVPEHPWLLVSTRRAMGDSSEVAGTSDPTILWLTPLRTEASRAIALAVTEDAPLADHELDALLTQAAGNPLYLRELLAGRRRSGGLQALPGSIEEIIAAELDGLAPDARRVVRCAAVLGGRCDRQVLELVLAADAVVAGPETWEAVAPYLVDPGTGGLAFRQALVRDAAYEALPFNRRKTLHAYAASSIERVLGVTADVAGLLAMHYHRAELFEPALIQAQVAAERAAAIYASVEAAQFLECAIECAGGVHPVDVELLARLDAKLGDAWRNAGDFGRAAEAYRSARRLAVQPSTYALLNQKMGDLHALLGNFPLALRCFRVGLNALNQTSVDARGSAARLSFGYAWVRFQQGRMKDASTWAAVAQSDAVVAGDEEALGMVYQLLDMIDISLGHFTGLDRSAEALELFERAGNLHWQGVVFDQRGQRAYYLGRWEEAVLAYERAKEVKVRIGDRVGAAMLSVNIAEILLDQGRLVAAEPMTRDALRVLRAAQAKHAVAYSVSQLGIIVARTGRVAEGIEHLTTAIQLYEECGIAGGMVQTRIRLAECLLLEGRANAALAEAGSLVRAHGAELLLASIHRLRGRALAMMGDVPGAIAAFDQGLMTARAQDSRHDVALVLDALITQALNSGRSPLAETVAERDELFGLLGMETSSRATSVEVPGVPAAG